MWCLGGFRCESDSAVAFNFGTNKARALLVYLAVEAPRSFRRGHLAGLLWSEYSEDKALHNLRQTLVRLSKGWSLVGGEVPLLNKNKDTVAINPAVNLWVDLLAFETAYERALHFFRDRRRMEKVDIASLIEAVTLYEGPFLDRFYLFDTLLFDEWSTLVRERTTKKALKAQNLLCEYYEKRGDYAQASRLADQIAALVPWDNQACAQSMRLYAVQKHWTNAKRQYDGLNDYLKENLNVAVNPSVTALYEEIRTLSIQDEALSPTIPVGETQIPVITSSFVGRQAEIPSLCHMLADPQKQLVSLVGRGGTGKSRLAIELGHLVRGLYAQGVFFISVRDISSIEGLERLLAENVKLSFTGMASYRQQLIDFLGDKVCLLILDGCEHHLLFNPLRDLVHEILENAPEVKILATSREPLNLAEEHVFPLVGLEYHLEASPGQDGPISEAVALFTERARQVNHQFTIRHDSLLKLKELCLRVEGHPLSIELMASATATRTITDLLDDLNIDQSDFDPLTSALPGEGRALSIVTERSWQFLSEHQRVTLCRLVSFQGGFTQAAAAQIAHTSPAVLLSLVEKSFIQTISPMRYIMHEVIRDFVTHKSLNRNLLNTTRETHADYFVTLLETLAVENENNVSITALEQIEADFENILTAWGYYLEQRTIKRLEGCIDILYQFYNIRSLFTEGIHLFENALHSASYLAPFDPLVGMVTNRLGSLALRMRRNEMAFQMYTRGLAIFEPKGNSPELGLTYLGLGNFCLRSKDFPQALNYAQKAKACFSDLGERQSEGTALFLLGLIHERLADYPTAKVLLEEALEISSEFGDQRGMILRLNQLAGHDCNVGDYETAERRYQESLALSIAFKDRFQQAIILNNLASVYHPRREYQKEQSVLEESLAICREIGDLDGVAIALSNLGELAIMMEENEKALEYARSALDVALKLGEDWTIIAVYDILGCAYLGLGDEPTAQQCLMQAIQMAFQIQSWDLLARSTVNLSRVYLARNQRDMAQELLVAALRHPSILFDHANKAVAILEGMGIDPPAVKDGEILPAVLQHRFGINAA